jgi:hypothetical protein
LCAAKNLNSKKPWKKKNQRVFFGRVVSERNVGGGTVVNVHKRRTVMKMRVECCMVLFAVDGDETISESLNKL